MADVLSALLRAFAGCKRTTTTTAAPAAATPVRASAAAAGAGAEAAAAAAAAGATGSDAKTVVGPATRPTTTSLRASATGLCRLPDALLWGYVLPCLMACDRAGVARTRHRLAALAATHGLVAAERDRRATVRAVCALPCVDRAHRRLLPGSATGGGDSTVSSNNNNNLQRWRRLWCALLFSHMSPFGIGTRYATATDAAATDAALHRCAPLAAVDAAARVLTPFACSVAPPLLLQRPGSSAQPTAAAAAAVTAVVAADAEQHSHAAGAAGAATATTGRGAAASAGHIDLGVDWCALYRLLLATERPARRATARRQQQRGGGSEEDGAEVLVKVLLVGAPQCGKRQLLARLRGASYGHHPSPWRPTRDLDFAVRTLDVVTGTGTGTADRRHHSRTNPPTTDRYSSVGQHTADADAAAADDADVVRCKLHLWHAGGLHTGRTPARQAAAGPAVLRPSLLLGVRQLWLCYDVTSRASFEHLHTVAYPLWRALADKYVLTDAQSAAATAASASAPATTSTVLPAAHVVVVVCGCKLDLVDVADDAALPHALPHSNAASALAGATTATLRKRQVPMAAARAWAASIGARWLETASHGTGDTVHASDARVDAVLHDATRAVLCSEAMGSATAGFVVACRRQGRTPRAVVGTMADAAAGASGESGCVVM